MGTIETRCCIVGGGPAGMMVGLLLARAGIDVTVLEQHANFPDDFRGDTVHPSTLELMDELGWLDDFLERPHQELREIGGQVGGERLMLADFSRLPTRATRARFVVLIPPRDFIDFLASRARWFPTFHLAMESEVVDLLREDDRTVGVRAITPAGLVDVRADLTIGADGRASTVRAKAGLVVHDLGAPIDVLWMRLSRRPGDPDQTLGHLGPGQMCLMLARGDYWQCALVIAKGTFEVLRSEGLDSLRRQLAAVVPFLSDRLEELRGWEDVRLLPVRLDRLREWARPGLLCIGDAAHAMSPIGGVGINLAIQDAVAAANLLAVPLRAGVPSLRQLKRVQGRRERPTRWTQSLQMLLQDRVISPTLAGTAGPPPTVARLLDRWAPLRRIPARLIGLGFRPEHISEALDPLFGRQVA